MFGQIWNETFPPPDHMSGMGALQIPLPEGYQAKNWKVQLRWPHEMMNVICFTDTVTEGDCGGEGQGSSDAFRMESEGIDSDGQENPGKDAKEFIISSNHISGMRMFCNFALKLCQNG